MALYNLGAYLTLIPCNHLSESGKSFVSDPITFKGFLDPRLFSHANDVFFVHCFGFVGFLT